MKWSIEELLVWNRYHCLQERMSDVLDPRGFEFPADEEAFPTLWRHIESTVRPHHKHAMILGIAAAALARRKSAPDWFPTALEQHLPMELLGFPFSWQNALEGRWALFPVGLANNEHTRLIWAMIGQLNMSPLKQEWPGWWETLADPDAVRGVHRAIRLLVDQFSTSFFFWPVLPRADHPVVFGGSLTLPVFMAGWATARGVGGRSILCTGNIRKDGSIAEAGFLKQKAQLAFSHGFRGLLCPRVARKPGSLPGGLKILEAPHLEEACFLWELFDEGDGGDLRNDFHSLMDPARLAATVHLLSDPTLRWSEFGERYRGAVQEILKSADLTTDFIRNLEKLEGDPHISQGRLERLLEPFDSDCLQSLGKSQTLSAFRLAQIRTALANHRGRIDEAEEWTRISAELAQEVLRYQQGLGWRADHLNHDFVHRRHNYYDFRTELPEALRETLDKLENLYTFQKKEHPYRVLPSLGKLYGTLAQNCGFCGPEYLEGLCRYALLAQEAFGKGRVPEYLSDWQRQFCYLFYGLLDAQDLEGAAEMLSMYLGGEPGGLSPNDIRAFNPFQHTAMARFFAETGSQAPEYRRWLNDHLTDRPCQHPWPLWLMNAGLCLENPSARREAFTKALDYFLALGPTAQVMGLMPLQLLWKEGHRSDRWVREKAGPILDRIRSSFGDRPHFSALLVCSGWQEALLTVERLKPRLFPFTYR
ncbi:MAG: hypothetical protein KBH99_10950 [Syntrophobacteraceae bacterium]|nr:hypothetical protein [Syntrophobacteraceae bacterium]